MTKVFVSTCHICIEELSYDPKEIKKVLSNKCIYM